MEVQLPIPLGSELRHLLDPVDIETWANEYAGRRALLIRGNPEKFAALAFDQEAFFQAAERFDINANRLKAAVGGDETGESYVTVLPFQARALYQSGLTICVTAISDEDPRLGAFAEAIRHSLSIPDLRFNSYLSPDGSGFNLHYDAQPIFLMQMVGRKRWWYGEVPITPTPRVYSNRYDDKPDLDSLEYTVLEPGDVLYLPAFTWHRARAEGFSLGITLGTKGVHNRVMRRALESSPFHDDFPVESVDPPLDPGSVPAEGVPEAARAYLQGQLDAAREYVGALTVEDLWRIWVDEVQASKGTRLTRRQGEVFSNLVVRRAPRFPVIVDSTDDGVRVRHIGHEQHFESQCADLVRQLLDRDGEFRCAEAIEQASGQGLTRSEVKAVLRDLIAIGILDPVRAE